MQGMEHGSTATVADLTTLRQNAAVAVATLRYAARTSEYPAIAARLAVRAARLAARLDAVPHVASDSDVAELRAIVRAASR